jgi:hypothetical protein
MKMKLTVYEPPENFPTVCDFRAIEYYNKNGDTVGKCFCGLSEETAKKCAVKAVYFDDDAKRFLWRQSYDRLAEIDRKAVLAVFPDILQWDAADLKDVRYIVKYARKNIQRHFGEVCDRCGGTGSYARSVAFTVVDNGICHKCGGTGKVLPRLTNKKVAEMANFFTDRRQGK